MNRNPLRFTWHVRLSLQSLALKMWLFNRLYHSLFSHFSPSTTNMSLLTIFHKHTAVYLNGFYHLPKCLRQPLEPKSLHRARSCWIHTPVFAEFFSFEVCVSDTKLVHTKLFSSSLPCVWCQSFPPEHDYRTSIQSNLCFQLHHRTIIMFTERSGNLSI